MGRSSARDVMTWSRTSTWSFVNIAVWETWGTVVKIRYVCRNFSFVLVGQSSEVIHYFHLLYAHTCTHICLFSENLPESKEMWLNTIILQISTSNFVKLEGPTENLEIFFHRLLSFNPASKSRSIWWSSSINARPLINAAFLIRLYSCVAPLSAWSQWESKTNSRTVSRL